eukprot:Lankesteria_metandrocarpae@DN6163_c0_g1_i1.p1
MTITILAVFFILLSALSGAKHVSTYNFVQNAVCSNMGLGLGSLECFWHCSGTEFVPQCSYESGKTYMNRCEYQREVICKASVSITTTSTPNTTTPKQDTTNPGTNDDSSYDSYGVSYSTNSQSENVERPKDGCMGSTKTGYATVAALFSGAVEHLRNASTSEITSIMNTQILLLGSNLRQYFGVNNSSTYTTEPHSTATTLFKVHQHDWAMPCRGFITEYLNDITSWLQKADSARHPSSYPLVLSAHSAVTSAANMFLITNNLSTNIGSSGDIYHGTVSGGEMLNGQYMAAAVAAPLFNSSSAEGHIVTKPQSHVLCVD